MTTTVIFDIQSDDEDLRAVVTDIKDDPVAVWRLAVFCAQMQLEKALKAEAIREHYNSIHMRAKATRAKRETKVIQS